MKRPSMTSNKTKSLWIGPAVALLLGFGIAGCGASDTSVLDNGTNDAAATGTVSSTTQDSGDSIKALVVSPAYHKIVGLGQTVQLSADVWFNDGTQLPDAGAETLPVHWTTDNYGIADVDDTGLVTGVSSGETLIHAVVDGHEALARIVVQNVSSLDPNIDPGLPPP